jgi:peroxiredoxin
MEWQGPTATKLLALAEKDAKSSFALEAASWVMLNRPAGPEVEKAEQIVIEGHLRSPNLAYLCNALKLSQLRSARKLLEAVLENNPGAEVQAHACSALATLLKIEANQKGDQQAAAKAALLLERIISEYGSVTWEGTKLADRAEPELDDLRRFGVGAEAPEIEGMDLDGQQIRLSDYRGQLVLLNFWGTWCGPCMAKLPEERKLVERMAGQPFALIGINSDKDVASVKRVAARENITWRSFRDGGSQGPIARAWNVQHWPTLYLLDRKGIVRYRDVWGETLARAVDTLMAE